MEAQYEEMRVSNSGKISFHKIDSIYGIDMQLTYCSEGYNSIAYEIKNKQKAIQKFYNWHMKRAQEELKEAQTKVDSLNKLKELI